MLGLKRRRNDAFALRRPTAIIPYGGRVGGASVLPGFQHSPFFDPDTSATLTHGGWRFLPGAAMTEPHLALVDLSTQDLEHALAHAEQPTRYCPICANGSPIRPEDYDRAIQARMY